MVLSPRSLLALLVACTSGTVAEVGAQDWTVLKPAKATSRDGAKLTIGGDGSILAGGASPDVDRHVIEVPSNLDGVTGIRLEVLPDGSLPKSGPGRSDNGNFVLTGFEVELRRGTSSRGELVPIRVASADHAQGGWPPGGAIDGVKDTGWAILPRTGKPTNLVLELSRNAGDERGATWVFTLDFQFGGKHTLGKYRLSATRAKIPVRANVEAEREAWNAVQAKVNQAIDKGIEFLLSTQELDGSWSAHHGGFPTGQTALSLYALLKSGVPSTHPAVLRAVEFLRGHDTAKTYSLACRMLAIHALKDEANRPWMEEMAARLASWQKPDGGYGYPTGGVDLSNTQYGALGLRAAAAEGIEIPPEVWWRLAQRTLKHAEEGRGAYSPTGYRYRADNSHKADGSMTAAGVGILGICLEHLNKFPPAILQKAGVDVGSVTRGVERGLRWLGSHFSVSSNPIAARQNWLFYYLYGLERVGGVTSEDEIGGYDWYREGARFFVSKQAGSGAWGPRGDGQQTDTAFGLLFLVRATSPATGITVSRGTKTYGQDDPKAEVSIRATGDTPLSVWVSSFSQRTLVTYEWPGEEDQGPRVKKVEYVGGTKDWLESVDWRSTDRKPGKNWLEAGFSDRSWDEGPVVADAVLKKRGDAMYLRRTFQIDKQKLVEPRLELRVTGQGVVVKPPLVCLFDEDTNFPKKLNERSGKSVVTLEKDDANNGEHALRITPVQRYGTRIPGWQFAIAENPSATQYRYIRFAWKKEGSGGLMLQLADRGQWNERSVRYLAGSNDVKFEPAISLARSAPSNWKVVTRDLWEDFGKRDAVLTGLSIVPMNDGAALLDTVYLARSMSDFRDIPKDGKLGRAVNAGLKAEEITEPTVRVFLNGQSVFEGDLTHEDWEIVLDGETLVSNLREGENLLALQVLRSGGQQTFDARLLDDDLLAVVPGDPGRASRSNRFPSQIKFDRAGEHPLRARVHVLVPDEREAMVDVLESRPFTVNIQEVLDPEMLSYASDASRNLLGDISVTTTASSTLSDGWKPELAVDNLHFGGWLSSDADPHPTLRLDLDVPVRANTILLSHTRQDRGDASRTTRAKIIEVTFNGRGPTYTIEMIPDDLRKTVFQIPKPLRIQRIEFKVLERANENEQKRAVGFAEVELQTQRRAR